MNDRFGADSSTCVATTTRADVVPLEQTAAQLTTRGRVTSSTRSTITSTINHQPQPGSCVMKYFRPQSGS